MKTYTQCKLISKHGSEGYTSTIAFLVSEDIEKGKGKTFTLKDEEGDWSIHEVYKNSEIDEETLLMKRAGLKTLQRVLE